MKQIRVRLFIYLLCVALNPGTGPARVQADGRIPPNAFPNTPKIIRFASIFDIIPGISTEDARLSLEMIMRKTMSSPTHPFRVELDFLSDYVNAVENIKRGNYHFIALTGMDYVDLRRNVPLSPLMVLSKMEKPTESLLLIIRNGESLDSIGRKPNSILMLEAGRVGVTARMWLETVLWEQGFEAGIQHFSEIQYAQKTSRIVLPVFFGKADACVIEASAFEIMTDLNPQLGRRLEAVKTSEPLVLMLICATQLAEPEDKNIMTREAMHALMDPYSRQALTMVQMKQFFASKPEYLASTETLFERYQRMADGHEFSLPADTKAERR